MKDSFGREIDYMRISVTDRCNLRCRYCMPEEGIVKVDRSEILSCEEIIEVCRAATELGIVKFKITGGEPLVRGDVVSIIRGIKALPLTEQVTLTTNGQKLAERIDDLADAGIDGINISLDTLRADRYEEITRGGSLEKVLDAIGLCTEKGIRTRLNCLVQKGFNEDEITALAAFAFERGIDIRFIEMMPIGIAEADNGMSNREVLQILRAEYPALAADDAKRGNGPAVYYSMPGVRGSVGFISAMHDLFCGSCNRIRLTSMGYIKPCLCYEDGVFIRPYLSRGEEAIMDALKRAVRSKPERHHFGIKSEVDHHSMAQIGG